MYHLDSSTLLGRFLSSGATCIEVFASFCYSPSEEAVKAKYYSIQSIAMYLECVV